MKKSEFDVYLKEEKLYFDSDGEQGNEDLKCPSCDLMNFVHAGGVCELEVIKKIDVSGKKHE